MQVGVKFLACRVDSGNVLALEVFHKLVVDEVHALLEAVQVATLVDGIHCALQVINHRQQVAHRALGAVLEQVGLFLERALAEVLQICHQEQVFTLLVFELFFEFGNPLFGVVVSGFLVFVGLLLGIQGFFFLNLFLSGLGLVVLILFVLFRHIVVVFKFSLPTGRCKNHSKAPISQREDKRGAIGKSVSRRLCQFVTIENTKNGRARARHGRILRS